MTPRSGLNDSFTAEPQATAEPGQAVACGSAVNESNE